METESTESSSESQTSSQDNNLVSTSPWFCLSEGVRFVVDGVKCDGDACEKGLLALP